MLKNLIHANPCRRWGDLSEYCIGEELHEDGGKHFHCYFEYEHAIETKSEIFFDLDEDEVDENVDPEQEWQPQVTNHIYHPNIKKAWKKWGWIKYITKEDKSPETNMDLQGKMTKKRVFADALDAEDYEVTLGWQAWLVWVGFGGRI